MRRAAWIWSCLLLQTLIVCGEEVAPTGEIPPAPPAYKILRFTEDYSYLSNSASRSDWLDPIKYIPLRAGDPYWYLTFGGEVRERFEGVYDPGFGIHAGNDSYWLQRITLLADLHLGQRVRIFAEGISGEIAGESGPPPATQKDPLNLQSAFMDVVPYLTDDERWTLRAGRFGLSLGSGRLVATRASPNIPFKFDGFETIYATPAWHVTAFLTRPVKEVIDKFDSEDYRTEFWGLYLTRWFDPSHKSGVDAYYLGIAREHGKYASGTGNEHRHSLGARLFGEKNGWDWNGEGAVQVGSFGNESILAWTASFDGGYTLNSPFQPRFGLKADVASGDKNPNDGHQGTFDALFFKSGYFNDASLIRPANIIDVHPNLAVNLTKKISLNGGVDAFWRYSRSDAVYAPPGFVTVPALKTSSSYVGTAADLNFEWRVQRHISFLASYVHFFTGDYVHAAGGGDVNYVSTTMSFLF